MFKRIDTDKNGSLSIKEFKVFYSKIRSRSRSSRGPQTEPQRSGPQRFGQDRRGSKSERPDRRPEGEGSRGKGRHQKHDK